MNPKFFIFLDIDGVMYDWKYLLGNNIKNNGIITTFNPASINALNSLIAHLSKNYTPILVISSTWRRDMMFTVSTLRKNGLKTNLRHIFETPILDDSSKRGLEILKYLSCQRDKENYVIIDDEMVDFREHFDLKRIIKTDMFNGGLDLNKVNKFLQDNNLGYIPNNDAEKTD